jgi:transposase
VVSCYEAGYDMFWLHRWLEAQGVDNHVLDPGSLEVSRRARRAKTDRIDAVKMLRALRAYLGGDRKACSVVRVPSIAEEDAKRVHRERERLIRERGAHTNRLYALLRGQGVRGASPLARDFVARLKDLRSGDGHALAPALIAELVREQARLRLIVDQLAALEQERRAALRSPAPATAQIEQLAKLKGIGEIGAQLLVGEVFYRDFANRRQLGSYFGLTGSPFQSGRTQREQGIDKAGNHRARALAVELAWLWLRHQPDSALSRWFRDRVGRQTGRVRKIAVVALARKLMVALWRFLATGLVPTGAALKA